MLNIQLDESKMTPGRFTHHFELYSAQRIDEEVRVYLHEAWSAAKNHPPIGNTSNLTLFLCRVDNLPTRFCYNLACH